MSFSEATIQSVWEKGSRVTNNDPSIWRLDRCGAWMQRGKYGNRASEYGWEIDHISPGGSDSLSNLRPLQWQNNVDKGDGRLKCKVTAKGVHNAVKRPSLF